MFNKTLSAGPEPCALYDQQLKEGRVSLSAFCERLIRCAALCTILRRIVGYLTYASVTVAAATIAARGGARRYRHHGAFQTSTQRIVLIRTSVIHIDCAIVIVARYTVKQAREHRLPLCTAGHIGDRSRDTVRHRRIANVAATGLKGSSYLSTGDGRLCQGTVQRWLLRISRRLL